MAVAAQLVFAFTDWTFSSKVFGLSSLSSILIVGLATTQLHST
jgi:hypothetical protein